jgi:AcrR family transcriptional regulator
MARTTRTDWLDEGLHILRDVGQAGLTIEELCRRLSRTKGAYYHHFKDVGDYVVALLEHWEATQTSAPIYIADKAATPRERRRRLDETVSKLDMRLEVRIRAWALESSEAKRAVLHVDERRVDYLSDLYAQELGSKAKGKQLATLEYLAFVGAQQLFAELSSREARAAYKTLRRGLELLAQDEPPKR